MALCKNVVSLGGFSAIIRNVDFCDIAALNELSQTYDGESGFFANILEEFKGSTKQGEEIFDWQQSMTKLFLVAEVEGKIVGACFVMIDDKNGCRHKAKLALYIQKEYQCHGISNYMFHEALGWCKRHNIEKINIKMFKTNHKALAFAQRFGFEIEGIKKKEIKMSDNTYQDIIELGLCI